MPHTEALGGTRHAERGTRAHAPGGDSLKKRLSGTVEGLIDLVSRDSVTGALEAPSQFASLLRLMDAAVREKPELVTFDREIVNALELAKAREELLRRFGGVYDTAQAAELLGVTAEAVRKRIHRGTLLWYRAGGGEYRLPAVQFSPAGVLDGTAEVLAAMHVEDPWMRIQLYLDEDVLGALREGRVEDAVEAAGSYLPTDEPEE